MHESGINQRLQNSLSAAVNVHRIARHKMHEIAQQLCRTFCAGAANRRFIFVLKDRCAAHRTDLWHFIRHGVFRPLFRHITENFRYNLACFAHANGIANTDIFLPNKIAVVQGRAADSCARQLYRIQHGIWRQHAGSADSDNNIAQNRFFDFRRILIRGRPARIFCR